MFSTVISIILNLFTFLYSIETHYHIYIQFLRYECRKMLSLVATRLPFVRLRASYQLFVIHIVIGIMVVIPLDF